MYIAIPILSQLFFKKSFDIFLLLINRVIIKYLLIDRPDMEKGGQDKGSTTNVYEVKPIRRQFNYKFLTADVFNEFLYVGDEKGNLHMYPIRANDPEVIAKSTNEQVKNLSKSKIDKIQCYAALSHVFVLSDEKLYYFDSALREPKQIAVKVHDFAINEGSGKREDGFHAIVVISKKKEGYLLFRNAQNNYEQSKKFPLNELPANVGYNGTHIICSYKKEYECFNVQKNFASNKCPFSTTKNAFFKVTGPNELLLFVEDNGIFMDFQFQPKQKGSINLTFAKPVNSKEDPSRPVLDIALAGNYCLILCQGVLQIFTIFDPKKSTFVQEINISPAIRGITSNRPFIFGKDDLQFLYEIPYETQIKSLLERCRIDEAIALLQQNVGPQSSEQKTDELRINGIWPLIRRMQFDKAKEQFKLANFDIRQIVLLYPELASLQIESLKAIRPEKYMNTLIIQFINQKATKGKDDETDLKKKSKYFLKDILQWKRQQYLSRQNMLKVKISFNSSKYSLIKQKLNPATPEQLLEIIDFFLIRWHLDMGMFVQLENFFSNNIPIYCKKLFAQFQSIIKSNPKLIQFPTLKPRFFSAFDRYEQAYESWKFVAENNTTPAIITLACEQCVKLLTLFEDKREVYKKLLWILKKKPQIGMSFFNKVDINFLPPEDIIRNFENEKNDKYLELYLQTIVIDKKTEIESYHTKLLILYVESVFNLNSKQNKEESKDPEFQVRIQKMRKLLRNPESKYASEPILKRIEKCEWLLQDEIYLYSREKRHEEALRKYINKNMNERAEAYCKANRDGTLTIYFKLLLGIYKSYESSKNNSHILLKKDIISFIKKYSSQPELDPITVLQLIPDNWVLSEFDGGIYQFLQSAIIHTLHEKRSTYTSKHLSQMDLLNVQYNLIQAKRAYLRFTYKKKCCICDAPISDKYFVVYPNANVCHQACVKKQKNTVCPITKQDFEKTFKY